MSELVSRCATAAVKLDVALLPLGLTLTHRLAHFFCHVGSVSRGRRTERLLRCERGQQGRLSHAGGRCREDATRAVRLRRRAQRRPAAECCRSWRGERVSYPIGIARSIDRCMSRKPLMPVPYIVPLTLPYIHFQQAAPAKAWHAAARHGQQPVSSRTNWLCTCGRSRLAAPVSHQFGLRRFPSLVAMSDGDAEQTHTDEPQPQQQQPEQPSNDTDERIAAAEETATAPDDDNGADIADTGHDASSSVQSTRWRRAGVPPVSLPPLSAYSALTSCIQFPQLLSFLRTFRLSLGLTAFSTLDLLTALTQPASSPFHVELLWGLLYSPASCHFSLRKHREMDEARLGGAKVDSVRYPPWWQLFSVWWREEWPQLYDRNPLDGSGAEDSDGIDGSSEMEVEGEAGTELSRKHKNGRSRAALTEAMTSRAWEGLTAVERCVILEWLCEWKLQQEGEGGLRSEDGTRAAVEDLELDALRVQPLGYNEQGDAYYYFGHDAFVFIEHRSETAEQTALTTPAKAAPSKARGSRAKQPDTTLIEATSASPTPPQLLAEHATPHRWSVLCSTLAEMQAAMAELAEAAPEVAEWLQDNVADKMASSLERRRGAEERRARMALVPRKRSSRIQLGELRREEEERKEEERKQRQEEERQRKEAEMKERQRERNRRKREADAERMREIEEELTQEKLDTLASEREARQRERERLHLELRMRKAAQERREARRQAANRTEEEEDNEQQDEEGEDEAEQAESEADDEYGNVVKLVSSARLAPDETLQLFNSDNVSAHLKGRNLRVAVKRKGIVWPPPKEVTAVEEEQKEEERGTANGKPANGERADTTSRTKKQKERRKKTERRKKSEKESESSSASSDSSSASSSSSSDGSGSGSDSDSSSASLSSDSEARRRKKRRKKRRQKESAANGEAKEAKRKSAKKAEERKKEKRKRLKQQLKGEEEDGGDKKEKQVKAGKKRRKTAESSGGSAAQSASSSSASSPTAQSAQQQTSSQSVAQPPLSPLQAQQQQWMMQYARNAAMQHLQQQPSLASMSPQMQAAALQQYATYFYMRQLEQNKLQEAHRLQQQQQPQQQHAQQHPLPDSQPPNDQHLAAQPATASTMDTATPDTASSAPLDSHHTHPLQPPAQAPATEQSPQQPQLAQPVSPDSSVLLDRPPTAALDSAAEHVVCAASSSIDDKLSPGLPSTSATSDPSANSALATESTPTNETPPARQEQTDQTAGEAFATQA